MSSRAASCFGERRWPRRRKAGRQSVRPRRRGDHAPWVNSSQTRALTLARTRDSVSFTVVVQRRLEQGAGWVGWVMRVAFFKGGKGTESGRRAGKSGGAFPGGRTSGRPLLVDFAPTVEQVAGVPAPPARRRTPGRSGFPPSRRGRRRARPGTWPRPRAASPPGRPSSGGALANSASAPPRRRAAPPPFSTAAAATTTGAASRRCARSPARVRLKSSHTEPTDQTRVRILRAAALTAAERAAATSSSPTRASASRAASSAWSAAASTSAISTELHPMSTCPSRAPIRRRHRLSPPRTPLPAPHRLCARAPPLSRERGAEDLALMCARRPKARVATRCGLKWRAANWSF